MRKASVAVTVFAVLMLFTEVAPALASQPKLVYAFGTISYPDPDRPGTTFTTNDIQHGRERGGLGTSTGSPWGPFSSVSTMNFELNRTSYTGTCIIHYVNSNPRATFEGINNIEFKGAGLFIYHGPTFTAFTPTGIAVEISDGMPFTGALSTGMFTVHGTADNKGLQVRGTTSAVSLGGPLTYGLAGASIGYGTATYWYTGN